MTLVELKTAIKLYEKLAAEVVSIDTTIEAVRFSAEQGNTRIVATVANTMVTLHPDAALAALDIARTIKYEDLNAQAKLIGLNEDHYKESVHGQG